VEAHGGFYFPSPGAEEIQLDLILDYRSNVALCPAFPEYFRTHQRPLFAIWGKNDPHFIPPGPEAYQGDIPDAEVQSFDAGHFALETPGAMLSGHGLAKEILVAGWPESMPSSR